MAYSSATSPTPCTTSPATPSSLEATTGPTRATTPSPGLPLRPCATRGCARTPSTPETFAKGVFPTRMVVQETINAANGTGFYNSLDSALPANYTLVAGDEWGQVTLLHFSVVASNSLPKVGSFLANGGGCAENNNPVPCTASEFSAGVHLRLRRPGRDGLWLHHPGPLLGAVGRELHHNREVPVHRPARGARERQLHVQRARRHGVSLRVLLHGQRHGVRAESVRTGFGWRKSNRGFAMRRGSLRPRRAVHAQLRQG